MPGFPVEQFKSNLHHQQLNLLNEEFKCNICLDILKVPKMLDRCEHIFCESCFNMSNQNKKFICPNCRGSKKTTRAPHRSFLALLEQVQMVCKFACNGCPSILHLETLENHQSICDYANPNKRRACAKGCGAMLRHADIQQHNCIEFLKLELKNSRLDLGSKLTAKSSEVMDLANKLVLKNNECLALKHKVGNLNGEINNIKINLEDINNKILKTNNNPFLVAVAGPSGNNNTNQVPSTSSTTTNETITNGKLKLKFFNISGLKDGENKLSYTPIKFNGLSFHLVIRPKVDVAVDGKQTNKYLGVGILCKFDSETDSTQKWSCVEVEGTLVLQAFKSYNNTPAIKHDFHHNFNVHQPLYGIYQFIHWVSLSSETNGYVKNDSIYLEAVLKVHPPKPYDYKS